MMDRQPWEADIAALERISQEAGHDPECVFFGLDGFPLDSCDCKQEKERAARITQDRFLSFFLPC